jgi:hypothetical protein
VANIIREGNSKEYRLKVNGATVGRVRRVRTAVPMIGAPRTYTTTWHAFSGAYAQARSFETQQQAEDFLMAQTQ